VSAIAGLIPLAEKMSEEDCLALDKASADLIRDINRNMRLNTELIGIVSYFSQLAPRYDDARKALIEIAKNGNEDSFCRGLAITQLGRLAENHDDAREALKHVATNDNAHELVRKRADAALESLATSQLAGQKQLLEQQQR
jgi:hypothetical protein